MDYPGKLLSSSSEILGLPTSTVARDIQEVQVIIDILRHAGQHLPREGEMGGRALLGHVREMPDEWASKA